MNISLTTFLLNFRNDQPLVDDIEAGAGKLNTYGQRCSPEVVAEFEFTIHLRLVDGRTNHYTRDFGRLGITHGASGL